MAESAYLPQLVTRSSTDIPASSSRHSVVVRITHWINTISFFGLVVSGIAILLAHPRLYWGETGSVGTPSLIDLPLPFVLVGQSGWGRYLHFLSAWICVINGSLYVVSGVLTKHFRRNLFPGRSDLSRASVSRVVWSHLRPARRTEEDSLRYNILQRLAYLGVVFVLFPLMIWTGLAMSPAITSVFPALVTFYGGQQSARTIHFIAASLLVLFLVVHVAMVCVAGFRDPVRAMITGETKDRK